MLVNNPESSPEEISCSISQSLPALSWAITMTSTLQQKQQEAKQMRLGYNTC